VDFPAASPSVIGTGGTKLTTHADGSIANEVVWNELRAGEGAAGGGISRSEPVPAAQAKYGPDGRGVPDVAGNADPVTGYRVLEPDGRRPVATVVGGTSAVAPLYAALAARVEQNLGRPLGDLQSALYTAPASTFHDVVEGNNGAYAAKKGWDAASGLGSIDGSALLHDLRSNHPLA
jgi:kumamolisin